MTSFLLLLFYFIVSSFTLEEGSKLEPQHFYTSVFSLSELVTTQGEVVHRLKKYIENEEHNLYILTKYLIHSKRHNSSIVSPGYLRNPLNSFSLINRLQTDIEFIEKIMNNTAFCTKNLTLPCEDDLTGAATGLVRIQTTYQADIMEMTSCTYKELNCTPMTSSDCYELARSLFRLGNNLNHGLAWVEEAYRLYRDSDFHIYNIKKADLYKNIAYAYVWLNDTANATIWVDKIIKEEMSSLTREELHKAFVLKSMIQDKEIELFTHGIERPIITDHEKHLKKFQKVCREESNISPDVSNKLKCRYLTDSHPFLKLAPVKMEQIYINPDIMLFYDVIHEVDINVFKNQVDPFLFYQSPIISNITNRRNARIGKSSWLTDQTGRLEKLTERLTDLSGLDLSTADVYQITNYGIGGYFEPHFDFYKEMDIPKAKGNRLATFILYLTDVEEGGHTAFPQIGLKVNPRRGTAVLFTNLLQTGVGDIDSMHAGCPVIKGDKWIVTKWIHQAGQEFKKPCDLIYNYSSKTTIPRGMMMITGYPVVNY